MRRAAGKVFRTTCQCTVRTLSRTTRRSTFQQTPIHHAVQRYISSGRLRPEHTLGEPLRSSMYFRRLSVALVGGLVGYGAYYTTQRNTTDVPKAYAPSSNAATGDDVATRSVLVIGADELHTGTFVGEGPISKTTDSDGRKVVEMLTPDQATQKLRKMEESYFVNRGQGVVRYDLVQLPSNDPIEDDHAEKVVEVPGKAAPTSEAGSGNSDWMFWGVFDGHS